MKREHVFVLLILGIGAGCTASAQEAAPNTQAENRSAVVVFSAAPAAAEMQPPPLEAGMLSPAPRFAPSLEIVSPLSLAAAAAAPSPSPAADPRFVYGGRDDFRWQLAIGVDWLRFRSSIFNASAVGVDSSVTYFTNEWFGIEGNVATGFAPEILDREHVKLLVYGAGPKIALRQKKWEPWAHAIFGGAHVQPQTADNSKNAFAVELGGGADYRINPRFSGRLEADWVRTTFFSQSQNNFKLMGGIVFHF